MDVSQQMSFAVSSRKTFSISLINADFCENTEILPIFSRLPKFLENSSFRQLANTLNHIVWRLDHANQQRCCCGMAWTSVVVYFLYGAWWPLAYWTLCFSATVDSSIDDFIESVSKHCCWQRCCAYSQWSPQWVLVSMLRMFLRSLKLCHNFSSQLDGMKVTILKFAFAKCTQGTLDNFFEVNKSICTPLPHAFFT